MRDLQAIDDDTLIAEDLSIHRALKKGNLSTLGLPALKNILCRLDLDDISDELDVKQALDFYQLAKLMEFSDDETRSMVTSAKLREASTI